MGSPGIKEGDKEKRATLSTADFLEIFRSWFFFCVQRVCAPDECQRSHGWDQEFRNMKDFAEKQKKCYQWVPWRFLDTEKLGKAHLAKTSVVGKTIMEKEDSVTSRPRGDIVVNDIGLLIGKITIFADMIQKVRREVVKIENLISTSTKRILEYIHLREDSMSNNNLKCDPSKV
ncbi:hypothetical protein HZH68_014984 [Vespula germanica]|uniref:Uncharacterized protein n=1 Tax=Vespula germanica TaxID=30212 RepID=A0A834MSQ2_VESGE|nr:hypothetical protein HZH68_014984 [Vespula germanica]